MKRKLLLLIAAMLLGVMTTACSNVSTKETVEETKEATTSEKSKTELVEIEGVNLDNMGPVLTKIYETGTLVVGNDSSYPPFGFKDPNTNEAIGVEKEMATAITKKLSEVLGKEIKLQFESMDFSAVLSSLGAGTIDIANSCVSVTEERKEIMDFSDPYLFTKDAMLISVDEKDKYKSLEDFKDLTLGANTGSSQEKRANSLSSNVISLATTSDTIMQLKTGKVEAVVIDSIVAKRYIYNDDSLYAFEISDEELKPVDKAVALQKGNEDLQAIINATVAEQLEADNVSKWIEEYTAIAAEMQKN